MQTKTIRANTGSIISEKEREGYENATGKIPYGFTNDYMFRAILQKNQYILKGLCAALLHLEVDEITDVQVLNPINLGESRDDKEFILDIQVEINHTQLLDLEMQVVNYKDWPERSLVYLCRMYDQLHTGENYKDIKKTQAIGIVDFDLFPEYPELYSTYQLVNTGEKYQNIYSSKFAISVLNLCQIENASKTDKKYKLDYWAKLFRAKTWEEIRMVAEKDNILQAATESLYIMNQDEITRQRCRAREDAIRLERRLMEERDAALEENKVLLEEKNAALEEISRLREILEQNNIQV